MSTRPFLVAVTAILRTGSPERVRRAGIIDDLYVSGSAVPPSAEVAVDLTLAPVGRAIEARGTVRAPWVGECRRCLRSVESEVFVGVVELFEEEPVAEETYPLVGGRVDLEPLAREAVVLELPQAPLCREGCLGLCPVCGADLNEVACGCEAPTDPRWAVLDQLRTDR